MTPLRFLLPLLFAVSAVSATADIQVDIDFPGGSGEVRSIDNETATIILDPTDHPDHGWRCWWYVKLSGLEVDKPLTLDVGSAPWATPDRATYSIDGGKTWKHSPDGTRNDRRIRYQLPITTPSAIVAWGPPFVPEDALTLIETLAEKSPLAESFSLCKTREDRDTPALRVGTAGNPLIWVQARQHAWESGSSWVGKGFAQWLLSDAPEAQSLRENHQIVFVPIMDIDNAHRGAGGKNQKPQDHNRDWSDAPHWHAVRAAQKELRTAAEEKRLAMFIDLHNPGADNLFPYFYIPPADSLTNKARANMINFLATAKIEMTGPLRFTGRASESGPGYDTKNWTKISKNWVAHLNTSAVPVTLETAWNTPFSTTDGYLTIGRQLGIAIHRHRQSISPAE